MKPFAILTGAFIVILMALVQPCPAPAVAAIVALVALASVSAFAAFGAAVAAEIELAAAAIAALLAKRSNPELPLDARQTSDTYNTCLGDITFGTSPQTILVGLDQIEIAGALRNWVFINGVPESCISSVAIYNAQPNITALEAAQGSIVAINSTCVFLYGLHENIFRHFKRLANITD